MKNTRNAVHTVHRISGRLSLPLALSPSRSFSFERFRSFIYDTDIINRLWAVQKKLLRINFEEMGFSWWKRIRRLFFVVVTTSDDDGWWLLCTSINILRAIRFSIYRFSTVIICIRKNYGNLWARATCASLSLCVFVCARKFGSAPLAMCLRERIIQQTRLSRKIYYSQHTHTHTHAALCAP